MVANAAKDTTELTDRQRQRTCAALSLLTEHLHRQAARLAERGDDSGVDPAAAMAKADRLDTLIANLRQGGSLWLTFESALAGLEAIAAGETTQSPLPTDDCAMGAAGLRIVSGMLKSGDDEGVDTALVALRIRELEIIADLLERAGSFQVEFDRSMALLEEVVEPEVGHG